MITSLWMKIGLAAALVAGVLWIGHSIYSSIYDAGVTAERTRWQAAQKEADKAQAEREASARDVAAEAVSETREVAAEAVADSRSTTATAVERVRHVVRTITVPADCPVPVLPASVLAEGSAAVERARAAQRIRVLDEPDS